MIDELVSWLVGELMFSGVVGISCDFNPVSCLVLHSSQF